jgi:four helix bundle protein
MAMSTLYVESVGLASDVRALLSPIARRDQELAKRLRRACDEVPLHIAEGMCSTGREKRLEYGAAASSAREALACVRAAESVGYLPTGDEGLYERLDRLLSRILDTMSDSHQGVESRR